MINGISSSSATLYAQWLQQQQQANNGSPTFSLLSSGATDGLAASASSSGTNSLSLPSDLLAMLQSDGSDASSTSNTAASGALPGQTDQAGQVMPHHHHHYREQADSQTVSATSSTNANGTTSTATGTDTTNADESTSLNSLLSSALNI